MNLRQFMQATGLSQRQIDYWANMGMFGSQFQDPGSGNPRDYPEDLVPVVRIAKRLVELLPKDAFTLAKNLCTNGAVEFYEDVELRLDPTSELITTEMMRLGMEADRLRHDLEHVTAERDRAEQKLRLIERCPSQFDVGGVVVRCGKSGIHNQHSNIPDPTDWELKFCHVWHDSSPGVVKEVTDDVA